MVRTVRLLFALLVAISCAAPRPAAAEAPGSFAVVSDIHLDPFDPPSLARALSEAAPGDWSAIFASVRDQAFPPYGEDSNHALFASALAALAGAAVGADFLIVPGDLLAHEFEARAARALAISADSPLVGRLAADTAIYVAGALAGALPGRPVILSLGNNDSECGDYRITPGGSFLAATRETVRALAGPDLLSPDFDETYAAGGYYAMRHPTVEGTTVLVVNDVLWSADYRDACGGDGLDAAVAMFDWVARRFAEARAGSRRVWLVHHIPAGIDAYSTSRSKAATCPDRVVAFLKEPFATMFPALLRDYADIVDVSHAGHTHHDGYGLLIGADGSVVGVDKIAPAISPIFGQSPGFQLFAYDRDSGVPTDFETFRLANLEQASLAVPGEWVREYAFSEAYGEPGYSVGSVVSVWAEVLEGGPARDLFRRFYDVGRGSIGEEHLPAYVCAMGYVDEPAFTACYCGG